MNNMSCLKRYIVLFYISIVSQVAVAQWKFNVSLSVNGCSGFDKVTENWANAQLKQWNATLIGGFPTKGECENARSIVISSSVTDGKCKVQFTASPCVGSGGAVGNVDVLGVSKGGSFNSTNPVNEINDWSNDDMERMLALNNRFQAEEPAFVQTGDVQFNNAIVLDTSKPFRSLNVGEDGQINTHSADLSMRDGFNKVEMANDFSLLANKKNVQRYVEASKGLYVPYLANPQDLTSLLHKEFLMVSGYDVDAIRQKLPSERTDAEKQALIDYQEYRKKTIELMMEEASTYIDNTEEKKEIDRAILAIAVYPKEKEYRTDENGFVENTNFQRKDLSSFSFEDPMRSVANALEVCNSFEDGTGFHGELYYNEKTKTYVIAIAGSDDGDDWLYNNAANAGVFKLGNKIRGLVGLDTADTDNEVPQYNMAKTIADAINRIPAEKRAGLNIEIVGHSLGGGAVSIIGLATGLKTTTYNAARVPEHILEEKGLLDKTNNGETSNITAYHTSTDILTSVQQMAKTPAIGVSVDIGDPSTASERKEARKMGAKYGGIAAEITHIVPGSSIVGAIEGATLAEKAMGHEMSLVLRGVSKINMEKNDARLQRYLNRQSSLYKEAHSTEYQTQESIQIFTGY